MQKEMEKLKQHLVPKSKSKKTISKSITNVKENISSNTSEVHDTDICNCCSYFVGTFTMMILMMRTG